MPLTPPDLTGVTIKEFTGRDHASPIETLSVRDPFEATRRFLVTPWDKRLEVAKSFLGQVGVDAGNNRLHRLLPAVHPSYGRLHAYKLSIRGHKLLGEDAIDVPVNGETQTFHVAKYQSAVFDVNYTHQRFGLLTDTELNGTGGSGVDPGDGREYNRYTFATDPPADAEFLQLPAVSLVYTTSGGRSPAQGGVHGVPINYGAGVILPQEGVTYVWSRVPQEVYSHVADTAYRIKIYGSEDGCVKPMIGTVNKYRLFGRPAGTMLLTGFEPVRVESPVADQWEWDFHFKFSYSPRGWNRLLCQGRNGTVIDDDGQCGSGSGSGSGSGNPPQAWLYVSMTNTYHPAGSVPNGDSLYNETDHRRLWEPLG